MKQLITFFTTFILLFTALVFFGCSPAVAGFEAIDENNKTLLLFNRIKCSTGMNCTKVGDKLNMAFDFTGSGDTAISGYLQAQIASTTTTITISQCGSTFISDSADVLTLPEASTALGCRLTFVCGTNDDFDINPFDATDAFSITGSITGTNTTTVLTPAAGDALRCTDNGAGFMIEAVGVDLWAVLSTNGTITDVN